MSKAIKAVKITAFTATALVAFVAIAHAVMMTRSPRPADSEFGFGPRVSASGMYTATLEDASRYKVGKLLSTTFNVQNRDGTPASGMKIRIDGGMPQHGHGFPTTPRVTKDFGDGRYQIGGLKFNMGGWWELKLLIDTGAQTDSVVFNIEL